MDTYQPGYFFPSLEKDQGGNTHDRIAGCKINLLIDIDFSPTAWVPRSSALFHDGGKHSTKEHTTEPKNPQELAENLAKRPFQKLSL